MVATDSRGRALVAGRVPGITTTDSYEKGSGYG
nr:MAG TPA: hypothetical protein [Bacteriophage sp.]